MPKETVQAKRQRALEIVQALHAQMPEAKIELDYRTPLELLVAVILSAQCTDKRVNMVTPALFERFPTAEAYARSRPRQVEALIKTCGLYRSKAKNIVAAAQALVREHAGEVPTTREALQALPGVGRKTAGVVANHLGGAPAFPVDTHIRRLAYRMGLTHETNPDKVEADLSDLLPPGWWMKGHQLLIWHGRRTCFARAPACDRCAVFGLCPRRGLRARPLARALPRAARADPSLARP